MADITPARKLFDLLVSRDFDPEMLDVSGKPAPDPAEAEIFSFDFRAQSGKDYGTVVIMLGNEGDLEVYCADNVGKTMEEPDKTEWFQFLEQLKNFAVRTNRMNFGVKNLNHLRYSMQGQAAIKEGLFESWSGRKDVSYNAGPNESRLMIKHKRSLGEGEARFRYVESLFVETAEGERYKLPFKNLTAGKAMLEHIRNGGRPYDMRGQHISEMVSELTVLSRFRRANHGKLLEGDTAQLVEQTNAYYENLQRNLKSLTSRRGYNSYFESWSPAEVSEESMVIEGLKHLFVTQSIDQRIEDALPLIARIQQQENTMKEANIFEAWANTLMEGTWQLPDTPEKQARLVELMSQDLPVGADATNATEQLYDLLGDDHLFDQLEALADHDANADARQVIYDRLSELSDHPEIRKVVDSLNIDADAAMNPPEATNPADLEADEVEEAYKDPATQTEDPAGTPQPAYPEYQDDLASILKTAGVPAKERPAPDYEDEVDEGILGTAAGGLAGLAFGGPLGAIAGAGLGQAVTSGGSSMIEDEEETDEGWKGAAIGGALGTVGGEMVGSALGPIGRAVGGALGGTAGTMIGDKLGGPDDEEQLNEFIGPAIAAGAKAIMPLLSKIGPALGRLVSQGGQAVGQAAKSAAPVVGQAAKQGAQAVGQVAKQGAEVVAKNAGQIGMGVGAYQAITDTAKSLVGGVGEVYHDIGGATEAIAKMVGNSLDDFSIKSLAEAAVKYAIPIGILLAVLYGGKKLIDAVLGESQEETDEGIVDAIKGLAGIKKTEPASDHIPKTIADLSKTLDAPNSPVAAGFSNSMIEDGKEETSPLKGKYGHSGKLKEVSKDTSFLDRLKELSGMKK
jgi:hypothetical protein